MIYQMHPPKPAEAASKAIAPKRFSARNIHKLEYRFLTNLVRTQYETEGNVQFDALLAIPAEERIPALTQAYGKKTMHRLLVFLLTEFNQRLRLPAAKKLTPVKISVAACELMLESEDDYLSLEDVILFLHRTADGRYGNFKNLSVPSLLHKMEHYRQARHEVFQKMSAAKHARFKSALEAPGTTGEPASVGELLQQSFPFAVQRRA